MVAEPARPRAAHKAQKRRAPHGAWDIANFENVVGKCLKQLAYRYSNPVMAPWWAYWSDAYLFGVVALQIVSNSPQLKRTRYYYLGQHHPRGVDRGELRLLLKLRGSVRGELGRGELGGCGSRSADGGRTLAD